MHLHEYFAAIGLPATDRRRLAEWLTKLRKNADTHRFADGTMLLTWRDVSGSAVSIFVDDENTIVGALPYLASSRPMTVYVEGIERDDYFSFFDRVRITLAPGRAPTFTAYVHDLLLARDRIQIGKPTRLGLTALADGWLRPAPESADDPGDIAPRTPGVHHLRGLITRVDEPVNRVSHLPFQHAKLDTGHLLLDLATPEPDSDDPSTTLVPNSHVEGEVMLVATLDAAPLDATMAKVRLDR